MDRNREKQAAACAAVAEVEDGMVVGLGTGSTVAYAIAALAERVWSGLKVRAVATSLRTEAAAREQGIEMLDFAALASVDLCIDGVDEIDGDFRAIKGAGGAMLREKIVAQAAARMIAIADSSKVVERLGVANLPVETLPFATGFVERRIEALGGRPALRRTTAGVVVTDQGNLIFDCAFGFIVAPESLSLALSQIPGVVGHGLFIGDIDLLYVGRNGLVEQRVRGAA